MSIILIAVFGLLTRKAMLRQEKKIQELREKQLRDEQILGLGIMSASAAHELGTPLSTMAIIVEDLQHQNPSQEFSDDMNLLSQQINQCKNIIGTLSEKSKLSQQMIDNEESQTKEIGLDRQLGRIFENWLVYRPSIKLNVRGQDQCKEPTQSISISVEQAVTNLLNNAAEASLENNSDQVDLEIRFDDGILNLNILDHGKGLSDENKLTLGQKIQQSKNKMV